VVLGRIDPARLNVIADSSVRNCIERSPDMAAIIESLGVDLLLEGSARRQHGRVRVSVQLVRGRDRVVMWSNSYESTEADLLTIQADLADQAAAALELKLLAKGPDAPALDPAALDAYLRGCACWNQRTPEALAQALECFREATAGAPRFAAAHAALAECYNLTEDYGVRPPREAFAAARAAAARALELDSTLPQALTAQAFVRHRFDRDWEQAQRDYRRAIELNPSSSNAHHRYAEYLSQCLRHDEAVAGIARARRVDPFSAAVRAVEIWILYHARRYEQARLLCNRMLDEAPRFALARHLLGRILLQLGSPEEALSESRQAVEHAAGSPFIVAGRGVAAAAAGRKDEARQVLDDLRKLRDSRFVSPFFEAKIHAASGESDAALGELARAVELRSGWATDLAVDPELDVLRGQPAFSRMLRSVGP
jgi:tetratricopeptide (TPR) repeat protein